MRHALLCLPLALTVACAPAEPLSPEEERARSIETLQRIERRAAANRAQSQRAQTQIVSAPSSTPEEAAMTREESIAALQRIEAEAVAAREAAKPDYLGVETRLLEGDLVSFVVRMGNAPDQAAVVDYARCAAAQYALIRGYGFARHVRTNVDENRSVWVGDAVYTISSALPGGVATLDAEVAVASCEERGVPTV